MSLKDPQTRAAYNREYRKKNGDQLRAYDRARGTRPQNPDTWQKWYAKNKERIGERNKAWQSANRDKCNAAVQRYKERHPERVKENQRRTSQKNKVRIQEYGKRYRAARPNKSREDQAKRKIREANDPVAHARRKASHRAHYYRNRGKKIAWILKYQSENRDRVRAWSRVTAARRKARMAGASGTFTREQWLGRLAVYLNRCAYCTKCLNTTTATMDHVIPVSKGGSNWPSNIVPACGSCNFSKSAKRWKPKMPAQGALWL